MASKTATAVEAPGFPWWVVLIEGIFALIFGYFLITAPGATSVFLVTVLGFYWLIRGIFSIIEIFIPNTGTHWGWLLVMGILGIIAGMVVLRHPLYATALVGTFLIAFLAVDGLIMGIMGLIRAFTGGGWGPGILGILTIIIALFLFANVFGAVLLLPVILGAFMIVGGIVAIFYSFRSRSKGDRSISIYPPQQQEGSMKYKDAPRPSVQFYEVPPDNWMSILDKIDSRKEWAILKSNRPEDKERPYEVWIEGKHWNSCRTFQEAQQSINEGETAWREGSLGAFGANLTSS